MMGAGLCTAAWLARSAALQFKVLVRRSVVMSTSPPVCGMFGYVGRLVCFLSLSLVLCFCFWDSSVLFRCVLWGFHCGVCGNRQEPFLVLRVSSSYSVPVVGPDCRTFALPELTRVFPSPMCCLPFVLEVSCGCPGVASVHI